MPSSATRRAGLRLARAVMIASAMGAGACDPFNTGFDDLEQARLYENDAAPAGGAPGAALRVMTYNVKYGGARLRFFWECNGERTLMTEREVQGNLDGLAAAIRAAAPDVVLVQEVDTGASKRVAWIDEVEGLMARTGLRFGAYASQWKADYVPSDGEGAVDSGNAVLSRWPITRAVRHALALETDISALTRYFYLKRNVLSTRVAVPGVGDLAVVTVHAEAFSSDGTKKKHLDRFKQILDALDAEGLPIVAGGDLNSIPPGSVAREHFAEDQGCTGGRFEPDTYVGEDSWLDALYAAYEPDVTPAAFGTTFETQAPWYTFVGDERFPLNRKLDHLFTNGRWVAGSPRVLQGDGNILRSDHVPVIADYEVGP